MPLPAQVTTPVLPIIKTIKVGKNYTYLWAFDKALVNGREILIKSKTSVGKILDGGETGLVVWKDNFLDEHPELLAFNTYRREVETGEFSTSTEYQFVFEPKEGSSEANSMQTQQSYQAGATWALDRMLSGTPFLTALNRSFMREERALKLLTLAYYSLLYHSIDYDHFWNFTADTRLSFPTPLSAPEIRSFLTSISDTELSSFYAQLLNFVPRRTPLAGKNTNILGHEVRASHSYYVLDACYPNDLTRRLVYNQCDLIVNHPEADTHINRKMASVREQLHRNGLSSYANFAATRDDHALMMIERETAQPQAFITYNSHLTSTHDLCDYIHQLLPNKAKDVALGIDSEIEESVTSVEAVKNNAVSAAAMTISPPEITTYGSARPENLPKSEEEIVAPSTTGLSPRALLNTPELSGAKLKEREAILITSNGSFPPLRERAVDTYGISDYLDPLYVRLRHLYQEETPFVMRVNPSSHIFRLALKRLGEQLTDLTHFDRESKVFKLTLVLDYRYSEQDMSTRIPNSKQPYAHRFTKQLFVHMVFDFKRVAEQCFAEEKRAAVKRREEGEYREGDDIFLYEDEPSDLNDDLFEKPQDDGIEHRGFFAGDQLARANTRNVTQISPALRTEVLDLQDSLDTYLSPDDPDQAVFAAGSKEMKIQAQYKSIEANEPYLNREGLGQNTDALRRFQKRAGILKATEQSSLARARRINITNPDLEQLMNNPKWSLEDDISQKTDLMPWEVGNDDLFDDEELAVSTAAKLYADHSDVSEEDLGQALSHGGLDEDIEPQQREEPVMSARTLARVKQTLAKLMQQPWRANEVKLLVSNCMRDITEVIEAERYLDIMERGYDLLSYEVFCEEQQRLNPLLLKLRPEHDQYMRGQNFVLFVAIGLELMLQAQLNKKDRQYGGVAVRERLGIKDVPTFMNLLQSITAQRKRDGLYYDQLSMRQRSWLEFLEVSIPTYEAFNDLTTNQDIRLRR